MAVSFHRRKLTGYMKHLELWRMRRVFAGWFVTVQELIQLEAEWERKQQVIRYLQPLFYVAKCCKIEGGKYLVSCGQPSGRWRDWEASGRCAERWN